MLGAMANNRRQLAEEFTGLVLEQIQAEREMKMKPNGPVLETLSVRMPSKLKRRFKKAAKQKGIEQTEIVIHALRYIVAVILEDEEPGLMQMSLDE